MQVYMSDCHAPEAVMVTQGPAGITSPATDEFYEI